MLIKKLLEQLRSTPETIDFSQVISVIEQGYNYTPTTFINGDLKNEQGANEGSCKIFYFAKINKLGEAQTLALFGHYYRKEVLENLGGDDHGNIRNFMKNGWKGIDFKGRALNIK